MKKLIYLTIAFILTCFSTINAQSISINSNNKKQLIDLIGTDMERSASNLQTATNPQEIVDWCFKDAHNMACRVSYDKQQEITEGFKNFSFYDNPIISMKMVKKANPNVKFIATMKSDYNGYGHQNNLPDWICDGNTNKRFDTDKYAGFLADYLELMNKNNVTIDYLCLSKEWTIVNVYRAQKVIVKLNEICKDRGIPRPLYMGPASWAIQQGINYIHDMRKQLNPGNHTGWSNFYSAFTTHSFKHEPQKFPEFVKQSHLVNYGSTPAKAYDDETGYGAGGPLGGKEPTTLESILGNYSEKVKRYDAGIQGELVFEPFNRGDGISSRAVFFHRGEKGHRMKSYYIFQKFANHTYLHNFIAPVISDLSDVKTMSFANDNEIALWVINNSDTDYQSIDLNLSNFTINGQTHQYSWDINSALQGEDNLLNSTTTNNYNFNIKAKSVNLIVINLKISDTDKIALSENTLDFNTIDINDAGKINKEFLLYVSNQTTDVSINITGKNANAFSIAGSKSFSSKSSIYAKPIKVIFTPTKGGKYNAVINITSGSNTKQIAISGIVLDKDSHVITVNSHYSKL